MDDRQRVLFGKLLEKTRTLGRPVEFSESEKDETFPNPNEFAFYYGSFTDAAKVAWKEVQHEMRKMSHGKTEVRPMSKHGQKLDPEREKEVLDEIVDMYVANGGVMPSQRAIKKNRYINENEYMILVQNHMINEHQIKRMAEEKTGKKFLSPRERRNRNIKAAVNSTAVENQQSEERNVSKEVVGDSEIKTADVSSSAVGKKDEKTEATTSTAESIEKTIASGAVAEADDSKTALNEADPKKNELQIQNDDDSVVVSEETESNQDLEKIREPKRKRRHSLEESKELFILACKKAGRILSEKETQEDPELPSWNTLRKIFGPRSEWAEKIGLPDEHRRANNGKNPSTATDEIKKENGPADVAKETIPTDVASVAKAKSQASSSRVAKEESLVDDTDIAKKNSSADAANMAREIMALADDSVDEVKENLNGAKQEAFEDSNPSSKKVEGVNKKNAPKARKQEKVAKEEAKGPSKKDVPKAANDETVDLSKIEKKLKEKSEDSGVVRYPFMVAIPKELKGKITISVTVNM